jgi:hypothetical protein
MATCPKCGGYLGSHHRCRGNVRRALREISLGVAGGIAGFVGAFPLAEHPSNLLLLVTTLLGVVLTLAVYRYARF